MISSCSCIHEYQDAQHGRGKRVFNPTKKDDLYRCTVCKSAKTISKLNQGKR